MPAIYVQASIDANDDERSSQIQQEGRASSVHVSRAIAHFVGNVEIYCNRCPCFAFGRLEALAIVLYTDMFQRDGDQTDLFDDIAREGALAGLFRPLLVMRRSRETPEQRE